MSENIIVDTPEMNPTPEKLSTDYCLAQIEKITSQAEYLNQVIETLRNLPSQDAPWDDSISQKADALVEIVRCRETTNQKLIGFYEKVCDDLKPHTSASREEVAARLTEAMLDPTMGLEDKDRISIILQRYMQTL